MMHFSSLRCFFAYTVRDLCDSKTYVNERERERAREGGVTLVVLPHGVVVSGGGCINIVRDSPGVSFRDLLP
jgi:hypothetical protein